MLLETVPLDLIHETDVPAPPGMLRSLETFGQIMPIILSRNETGYHLVAGRRRVGALRAQGAETVEAIVREDDDEATLAFVALAENLSRSCNPANEARAIQVLLDQCDADGRPRWTQRNIATALGISQPQVSARIKLLRLVPDLFWRLETGQMAPSAGRRAADLPERFQRELAGLETVRLVDVDAARRRWQAGMLDLASIDIPVPTPARNECQVLANRLLALAAGYTGEEQAVLVEAARILQCNQNQEDKMSRPYTGPNEDDFEQMDREAEESERQDCETADSEEEDEE